MTEMDEDKIMGITGVLHRKVYGGYNEFEEDTMSLSDDMRVIEKLHADLGIAASRVAELEQSREEDRQRLRNTARNILKAGQPVEQVAQWTGLPRETVQALAAQL
jgi:coenzyme F420-reducing hydrogenase delta subunit